MHPSLSKKFTYASGTAIGFPWHIYIWMLLKGQLRSNKWAHACSRYLNVGVSTL